MNDLPIYLDYNATTPVDPLAAQALEPWLRERFGNPSSAHLYGKEAKAAVETARAEVAALIGGRPEDMIFCGSATEANNLAIFGVARALRGERRHLVTSAVEHPSVMQPMRWLEAEGWQLTVLPVDGAGRVRMEAAAQAIRRDTALISVMLANNETGTMQPVSEIAALAHARGAFMHVDAAQGAGKIPINVHDLGADLLTLAGHKFYAPKGVGALYVREGTPILPIMAGADHERGLRPGTENVPHIVALGTAARLAQEGLAREAARLQQLRDALQERLVIAIPGLLLNGHPAERLPNTLNLSFPGVAGWQLLAATPEIAASTGSACHAGGHTVSDVLAAMSMPQEQALSAIRLSLGRFTTTAEIEEAANALINAWRGLTGAVG
ncbi:MULTISPECIES: cysteine desulfurase family protein [Acidithiobacillus]|uniref:cysteine desulfurase n=4 Tax=Acidithiobacillus TaxID=119977 RepID=A0A179BJK6_ACIFR|nr:MULTISPECIES: cysteine desulfurase family protein [Acidithiobacillus]MEB8491298.1 cysteine desulfurase family protein [Acidithiobacillus ferriphilus]MEB8492441.1 cysteine desulfurase family protein [Acidithiobacillus ferriphilus]MEB8512771.1 cysteine desulfurase family protein [Acidithiobacillus ferriphilus]MEB8522830.1 cysteine desulfurase family protein [Acidithiobacillus ferriphilus]MEB8531766.1 cysteine desulfurase family protein [Acidithiobacillus ferriphilus]